MTLMAEGLVRVDYRVLGSGSLFSRGNLDLSLPGL